MECKLKSHPDKSLKNHLNGSLNVGIEIFNRNNIFSEFNGFMSAILLLHDLGKASSHFQNYILKKQAVHEKLKRHAEISALWFYFYAKEVLDFSEKYAVLGFLVIKHHHADLNNFKTMCSRSLDPEKILQINDAINYKDVRLIYFDKLEKTCFFNKDNFKTLYSQLTRNGNIKSERQIRNSLHLDDYIFLNYFLSILLTADKFDAIIGGKFNKINPKWQPDFVDNFKKQFKADSNIITEIRNTAYVEVENNIDSNSRFFSINLPTGAGKTLNVLNAALKLKAENSDIQRIIYCLPFTSIIDQNAKVFDTILEQNNIKLSSDVILKQHHLTDLKYIKNFGNEDKIYSAQDSEFYIEGWESELVITTFYQLLHTLLTNKNKSIRKFHNLTNSIIILDEVQAIPHKYWELIKTICKKSSEILNIRFILVTATMPLIFSEEKSEIKELAVSKQNYFNSLNRIKLDVSNLKTKITIDEFNEVLLNDIMKSPDRSRLIILNTIKSSLQVYKFLKKHIETENIIYLSSNIIPKERLKRINSIKENSNKKIIVSTQLVEAGVDIDVDIVYRDMAPLDSVFQACGRCNRNNSHKVSEVKLFLLKNKQCPFYSYIYDSVLTDSTKNCFDDSTVFDESQFLNLSNEYYKKVSKYAIDSTSEKILNKIKKLSLQKAFVKDDDNEPIFKLIDSIKIVAAFIEVDDEAMLIRQKYNSILEIEYKNPFDKRIELKTIRRKMASYIINIPKNIAEKVGYDEELGNIWMVTNNIVDRHYNHETGFIRNKEPTDYIF